MKDLYDFASKGNDYHLLGIFSDGEPFERSVRERVSYQTSINKSTAKS